jgi:hypothetical protein
MSPRPGRQLTGVGMAGSVLVIIGGLVLLAALAFLPYFGGSFLFRGREPTLWDLTTRLPVVLTVIGTAAIALGVASLLNAAPILPLLAACCSFYLFGQIFPDGLLAYNDFGVGFWLATSATVAMSLGGILALAGRNFAGRFARPS